MARSGIRSGLELGPVGCTDFFSVRPFSGLKLRKIRNIDLTSNWTRKMDRAVLVSGSLFFQNSDTVYQKINNLFILVFTKSESGGHSDKNVTLFPSSVII